jgi:hypothetical protein
MAGRQEKILDLLITKKHKGRPARAAKKLSEPRGGRAV